VMEDAQPRGLSRRAFGGALSAGVGAVAGGAIVRALIPTESSSPSPAATWNSDPHGPTQAGVARPVTPHPHALVSSFALPKTLADPAAVRTLVGDLATVGSAIASLIATKAGETPLIPDGGGDLAVTVGIGPRIARLVSSTGTG
ncbi:hypothetical protein, partial [Pedococcus sp. 2YAF34]|uniref:hypothetical protein n=1 Tax=Pedococcus sp. 2YAF34 TaxID=3233032 RepID=UPI003F977FFC